MATSQAEKKKDEIKFVTVIYDGKRSLLYSGHKYGPLKDKKENVIDGRMGTVGTDGKVYDPAAINKKGYGAHGSAFHFVPGTNVIPESMWVEIQEAHDMADLIDAGLLRLYDPKVKEGKKAPAVAGQTDDLDVYSDKDAIDLIANTMKGDTLTAWKRALDPKRTKVVKALDDQIRKIFGGPQDDQQ